MPETKGLIFHGEFSSADASGLSEENSRFTLYGAGSVSSLTIAAGDYVQVTDINIMTGGAMTVEIYDGSDNTVDAGEKLYEGSLPANGGICDTLSTQHVCQKGTYPKVKTSASGQIDVTIRGTIIQQPS